MLKNIANLQFITQEVSGKTHAQLATEACKAGVNWIQLRMKNTPIDKVKLAALEIKKTCTQHNATFIINDYVELALELNADGIHVGKSDMGIKAVRKLVGNKMIVGGSTNSFNDILKGADEGADYLGLGPYRFTNTKTNLNPILGIEGFEKIMNEYHRANHKIPIIAIGGITVNDVEPLMQLGVYGVAVSSAISNSNNMPETVNSFHSLLNKSFVTN